MTTNPVLRDIPDALETSRLLIRCPRPGDGPVVHAGVVETLAELRAWPASLPWAMEEPSIERSETYCREGFAAFISRKDLPMLVFLKEGNVYVGGSGLHRIDWAVPKFEVGFWCRKSYQGRGLMTEAVQAITDLALSGLQAQRVECLSDERNLASRRVCERVGYRLEGIMRNERVSPSGELRNTCLYSRTP